MKLGFDVKLKSGRLSGWTMTPRRPPALNPKSIQLARCLRVDAVHTHKGTFNFGRNTKEALARSVPLESLLAVARQIKNLEELHIEILQEKPTHDMLGGMVEAVPPNDICSAVLSLQELPNLQRLVLGVLVIEVPQHLCSPGWVREGPGDGRTSWGAAHWICITTRRVSRQASG